MQRLGVRLLLMAVVAGGSWLAWARVPSVGAPPANEKAVLPVTSPLVWQGPASCASMACHNGGESRGTRGSEYTTWVCDDKHARAYEVLFNEQSRRIARNLGIKAAEKEAQCLNCHAMNVPSAQRHPRFVSLADGVGCESCHGPAQNYLAEHYRGITAAEKKRLGMWDTKDLVVRAQVCVSCHVGKAGQDVNHDLIAAGHPRLNFEYAAYLANMPKHWDEKKDRDRYPDLEARAWAIGQVASAEAALELLAHRAAHAEDADPKQRTVWPEFAEYDCYSCHHRLQEPNPRPQRGFGGKTRILPLAAWYYGLLPQAIGRDVKVLADLEGLKALMTAPYPSPEDVRAKASAAAGQLRQHRKPMYADPETVRGLLRSLAEDSARDADWDSAAQRYLGLAAAYRTWGDTGPRQRDPKLKGSLEAMGKGLQCPEAFVPDSFRKQLKQIQTHLGK